MIRPNMPAPPLLGGGRGRFFLRDSRPLSLRDIRDYGNPVRENQTDDLELTLDL